MVEYCLEHEVLYDGLPANIHDKCDSRPDLGDVSEVLFGSHPDVSTTRGTQFLQPVNDVEIGGFVGDEVVGSEVAPRLRKLVDDARELDGGNGMIVRFVEAGLLPGLLRVYTTERKGS